MLEQRAPRRASPVARGRVVASLLTALTLVTVGAGVPARAQGLAQDRAGEGPAPTPQATVPVEPLPSATAPTAVPPGPPVTLPPPTLTAAPAPVAPPAAADSPIYERWWFWTAIAAFAVTAVVIIAASSGPSSPRTDLGNMPAF